MYTCKKKRCLFLSPGSASKRALPQKVYGANKWTLSSKSTLWWCNIESLILPVDTTLVIKLCSCACVSGVSVCSHPDSYTEMKHLRGYADGWPDALLWADSNTSENANFSAPKDTWNKLFWIAKKAEETKDLPINSCKWEDFFQWIIDDWPWVQQSVIHTEGNTQLKLREWNHTFMFTVMNCVAHVIFRPVEAVLHTVWNVQQHMASCCRENFGIFNYNDYK